MKVFVILFVVGSCIAHLHAQGGRTGGGAAADDQPEDGIWTEDDIINEEHVNDRKLQLATSLFQFIDVNYYKTTSSLLFSQMYRMCIISMATSA